MPRALLGSSPGNPEPVYRAYERLLARHGPALGQQPELKLRLLTSVLVVLREWASASQSNVGTAEVSAKTARGIISSACNRWGDSFDGLSIAESKVLLALSRKILAYAGWQSTSRRCHGVVRYASGCDESMVAKSQLVAWNENCRH